MTILTLDQGLILEAPNINLELYDLFDNWNSQAKAASKAIENPYNPFIYNDLEEEYE
ncbi:MAG: hypothetical protein S4CHLAM7_03130 [Chlamydiae bacterium]|nr:hypothetical protein [Chlamydiota bacterium]